MNILVLGRYTWLRLARSHYLKALWIAGFFVGIAAMGFFSNSDEMGRMMSVELAVKFGRWCAWLVSIWIGMSVLSGELSTFTARTLLTKPISRLESTIGLLLGGLAFVALMVFLTTLEIFVIARFRGVNVSFFIFLLQFSILPPIFSIMALSQLLSLVFARPVAGFLMLGLSFENFWETLYRAMNAGDRPENLKSALEAAFRLLPEWLRAALSGILLAIHYATPTYDRFIQPYQEFMLIPFPVRLFLFHSFSCSLYVMVCCMASAFFLSRKEI